MKRKDICQICGSQRNVFHYIGGPVSRVCKRCEVVINKWEEAKAGQTMLFKKIGNIETMKVQGHDDIAFTLRSLANHLSDVELSIRWIKACIFNINEFNKRVKKYGR